MWHIFQNGDAGIGLTSLLPILICLIAWLSLYVAHFGSNRVVHRFLFVHIMCAMQVDNCPPYAQCSSPCQPIDEDFELVLPPSTDQLNESKELPLTDVVWQYLDDKNQWRNMIVDDSIRHEKHFRSGDHHYSWYHYYGSNGKDFFSYLSDFQTMIQHNLKTGKKRNMRRLVVCNPDVPNLHLVV